MTPFLTSPNNPRLLTTVLLVVLAGCGDAATRVTPPLPINTVKSISVSPADLDVPTGYATRVSATVEFAGRLPFELKWTSSDPTIATVEREYELTALVTAMAPGSVTISASAGGKTASTDIAIIPYVARTPAHGFFWTPESGMTDLGVLPGMSESRPKAINNADEVVGFSGNAAVGRGFFWSPSTGISEIPGWPNNGNAVPTGINDAGQIIGYTPGPHAFIQSSGGTVTDLGTLGGSPYAQPTAINDSGVVVGVSGAPFRWTSAKGMEPLPFTQAEYGVPVAINDLGEIAGYVGYFADDGTMRAVTWGADNQLTIVLCCASKAAGVNESRTITGIHLFRTAFVWTPSTGMRELGVLPRTHYSSAVGINRSGQIVGNSSSAFVYRVFVWTEATGMRDIGVLPGKSVCWASAINDLGHVIGSCE